VDHGINAQGLMDGDDRLFRRRFFTEDIGVEAEVSQDVGKDRAGVWISLV